MLVSQMLFWCVYKGGMYVNINHGQEVYVSDIPPAVEEVLGT